MRALKRDADFRFARAVPAAAALMAAARSPGVAARTTALAALKAGPPAPAAALLVLLALAAAPAPAGAAVSVGHSGWEWGNPLPQGNTIRSLDFAGDRGWAAGDFGTLLRSDDGGATWTGIATGLTADLRLVRAVGAETVVAGAGCALRRSDDGGRSFRRLPWTASEQPCPSAIASFHFPSRRTGYLVATDGSVLRTADEGRSWSRRTPLPGSRAAAPGSSLLPRDVFFTSAGTGFAATGPAAAAGGAPAGAGAPAGGAPAGRIFRTTDGGESWSAVASQPQGLNGLHFPTDEAGYAAGDGSVLLRTSDGGATWTRARVEAAGASEPVALTAVRCAGVARCLIAAEPSGRLFRTGDGGASFAAVAPAAERTFAAAFASPERAVAAGAGGATAVSDDGGLTWTAVGGRLGGTIERLRAASATVAYAAGTGGTLLTTADGGRGWSPLRPPGTAGLADVSFAGPRTGLALDSRGFVWRTDDGGAGWRTLDTGPPARFRAILALDASRLLLVGPRGLRRATDGQRFLPVAGKALAAAALVDVDRGGGSLFAYGPGALFASADRGRSWNPLRRPGRRPLAAVDFTGPRTGFALDEAGRLWQTANRGRGWRELLSIGTDRAYALAFGDALDGYLAVDEFGKARGGFLLRTSDGGASWRPQLLTRGRIGAGGLAAPSATAGFVLAGEASLFATARGGDAGRGSIVTVETPRESLPGPATIAVSGALKPAAGGETVVVSGRAAGDPRWRSAVAQVARDGGFTTAWKVKATSIFVAQWRGDERRRGDGSEALTVTVGPPGGG